jgi:hypothetical protein
MGFQRFSTPRRTDVRNDYSDPWIKDHLDRPRVGGEDQSERPPGEGSWQVSISLEKRATGSLRSVPPIFRAGSSPQAFASIYVIRVAREHLEAFVFGCRLRRSCLCSGEDAGRTGDRSAL